MTRYYVDQETRRLQQKIAKQVKDFELFALLDLLDYMGYEHHEILFKSHYSHVSQHGLVEKIEFSNQPIQVTITMNFGLLGPNSPLPSYFFKTLEDSDIDEERFIDFMDYFNHEIMLNYIMSQSPERDKKLYRDWNQTLSCYLEMTALKSLGTLHWLFNNVFPEVDIEIENSELREVLHVETVTLGVTVLGSAAVFGSRSSVPLQGFNITIFCDEEFHSGGRAWARIIEERLQLSIFKILANSEIYLRIFQVIRNQQAAVKLGMQTYLGYDRMPGGKTMRRRIKLFEGYVEN